VSAETDFTLTPRQKRLVRESFEVAHEYSSSLTKLFYGRLFEIEPAARSLFKRSLDEQSRKLFEMLTTVVGALDRFEELRPQLADLGRKHVTYGATPAHYDVVRVALLWALAQALEQDFDRDTRAAWDQMLRAVTAAMVDTTVPLDESRNGR
jgi:hemoglobin-like flavoprotein